MSNPELSLIKDGAQVFQPNKDCVETLELLLERAKAGEIKTIAYAVLCPDDYTASGWCTMHQGGSKFLLLGAINYLAHRLLENINKDEE